MTREEFLESLNIDQLSVFLDFLLDIGRPMNDTIISKNAEIAKLEAILKEVEQCPTQTT